MEIFALLEIMAEKGKKELKEWIEKNKSIIDSYKIDSSLIEEKICLHLIVDKFNMSSSKSIKYSELATIIDSTEERVEAILINAISNKVVIGKLDDVNESAIIFQTIPRKILKNDLDNMISFLEELDSKIVKIKN